MNNISISTDELMDIIEDYEMDKTESNPCSNLRAFCIYQMWKYQPERLNPGNVILPAYYGNKFCAGCKEENCVCESLTTTNK